MWGPLVLCRGRLGSCKAMQIRWGVCSMHDASVCYLSICMLQQTVGKGCDPSSGPFGGMVPHRGAQALQQVGPSQAAPGDLQGSNASKDVQNMGAGLAAQREVGKKQLPGDAAFLMITSVT